jgi:hypothetical protein
MIGKDEIYVRKDGDWSIIGNDSYNYEMMGSLTHSLNSTASI